MRDLCLLMCDIDHFKRFNDTWGHHTGDQILRFLASAMQAHARGRPIGRALWRRGIRHDHAAHELDRGQRHRGILARRDPGQTASPALDQ